MNPERRAYKTNWQREKRRKEGQLSRVEDTLLRGIYIKFKFGVSTEKKMTQEMRALKKKNTPELGE